VVDDFHWKKNGSCFPSECWVHPLSQTLNRTAFVITFHYEELTAVLRLESLSLAQIERIVSKDVGMAAKILQLANSAFIGTRGRVSSLLQAVSLIGTESVRTLVLSVHVFSQCDGSSKVAAYLPALWDHSVAAASLAQGIATSESCTKAMVEESFTAGLLHDIGKVIFLSEMLDKYRHIVGTSRGSISELELEQLGCTHAQVGAYLMSIWAFRFLWCTLSPSTTYCSSNPMVRLR